jgi:hypothetical protein
MRTFLAIVGAAVALACSAAPALSMPIYHDRASTVESPQTVTAAPVDGESGTAAIVVVLIGTGALVAGTGLGFAAAHRRPLGSAA